MSRAGLYNSAISSLVLLRLLPPSALPLAPPHSALNRRFFPFETRLPLRLRPADNRDFVSRISNSSCFLEMAWFSPKRNPKRRNYIFRFREGNLGGDSRVVNAPPPPASMTPMTRNYDKESRLGVTRNRESRGNLSFSRRVGRNSYSLYPLWIYLLREYDNVPRLR